MYKNDNPFAPWNDPMGRDDPFAPHNDPMRKDSPFEPWNNPFGDAGDLNCEDREKYRLPCNCGEDNQSDY